MKNFTDALKDKRKTPLFFMIACALLCFSMSAALIIGLAANAELVGAELSESYSVGTDIEIPNGQISVNGELCDANYKVYLPDGTVSNADRLTLNETGKYVVEYSAEKDGRIYTETKSFFVYEYHLIVYAVFREIYRLAVN